MDETTQAQEAAEQAAAPNGSAAAPAGDPIGNGPVTEQAILDALKHVVDPELGINIVDLGLVYEVDVSQEGTIHIEYTLTTMGCPIGPLIEDQMRAFLAAVPGIGEVRPEMVLRPAWSPEMMSEEAKAALGMF